jgi:hypothetical protein
MILDIMSTSFAGLEVSSSWTIRVFGYLFKKISRKEDLFEHDTCLIDYNRVEDLRTKNKNNYDPFKEDLDEPFLCSQKHIGLT